MKQNDTPLRGSTSYKPGSKNRLHTPYTRRHDRGLVQKRRKKWKQIRDVVVEAASTREGWGGQWRDVGTSRQGLKVRETISNHHPSPPSPGLYISLPLFGRFFCSVLVIVYQAGQTKRAAGNWVSHLLPDMIDKSPPSAISAKLLFRRAAARFTPSSHNLLLLRTKRAKHQCVCVCVCLSRSFLFDFFSLSLSLVSFHPRPSPAQHLYGTRNRSEEVYTQ